MRWTAAIALLMLAACASAPPSPDKCGPQPNTHQVNAAVQSYVDSEPWKDPESVKIRNVQLMQCTSLYNGLLNGGGYTYGWQIAFEVNAKNSYGGYTGFEAKSVVLSPDGKVHWSLVD